MGGPNAAGGVLLVLGVGALLLLGVVEGTLEGDLLVPGVGAGALDLGGGGLGLLDLLEMLLFESEELEELGWLPAGLVLGEVDLDLCFFFSGVFFFGTMTLWGGGIWRVGS